MRYETPYIEIFIFDKCIETDQIESAVIYDAAISYSAYVKGKESNADVTEDILTYNN